MVSVVMPSFNRGKYLIESIECIKNQTYPNWELIIVDNGSSDKETLQVLEQLQNGEFNDPRITTWKLNSDYGIGAIPRNFGISKARGEYITFLDDDDLMTFDRLQSAMDIFEANKDVEMVICDITSIDHFGKFMKYEIRKPSDPELLRFVQLFQFTVYFQATIIRNRRLKPYIYNVPMVSEDREQFNRLIFAHNAKIARVTEYQGDYRRHPKQIVLQMDLNQLMWNPDKIAQKAFLPLAFPQVFSADPYYLYPDEQIIYEDFYLNPNQTVLTSTDKDVYKLTKTKTQDELDRLLHHRIVLDNIMKDFSCLVLFFADNKHQMPNCHIQNYTLVNEYLDKFDNYFRTRNTSEPLLRYMQQLRRVVREQLKYEQSHMDILNEIEQSIYLDEDINRYLCLKPNDMPEKSITIIANIIDDSEQIRKSIKSIQKQSFKNWNLLIIDSKDNQSQSRKFIEQLIQNDKRIKTVQQSDNFVQEIQSEYVAFFNLEGEMPEYRLCIQANYMHFNNHVDVLGGKFENLRQLQTNTDYEDLRVITNQQLRLRQLFGNHISTSTILMKSNCKECISYYTSGKESEYGILFKMMFEQSQYFEVLDKQMINLPETSQEYISLKNNQINEQQLKTKVFELFKREYSPIDKYMEQDRNMTQLYDALECLIHSKEAVKCAGEMKELFNIYFSKSKMFSGEQGMTNDQYNHAYSILKIIDLLSRKNELIDIWTILYDHSPYGWFYSFSVEQAFETRIFEEVLNLLI
eukprot:403335611